MTLTNERRLRQLRAIHAIKAGLPIGRKPTQREIDVADARMIFTTKPTPSMVKAVKAQRLQQAQSMREFMRDPLISERGFSP